MSKKRKNWENGTLEVSKKDVQKYLKLFNSFLYEKLNKKGFKTFNSTQEVLGKLQGEEVLELQMESHNRDLEAFKSEALDCAVVAFWGYVSANKWKKSKAI